MSTIARFAFAFVVSVYLTSLANLPEVVYWVAAVGCGFIGFVVLETISEVSRQNR